VLPYAVNGLMLLAGIGALLAVLRGDVGEPDEGEDIDTEAHTSWKTVALVALSFLSLIAFIPLAGWPIAVTVLFTGAALALGARSWWRATLIGLALGVVTQFVFGVLLGLSLPAFGTVIPRML
jgi:putative tricarboxylic transport membrane protein